MDRHTVKTGVEGLDDLLNGGIPRGSTVLISGPPGAGKTVLALQYAFYRAGRGDRVLFVSTCEPLYKINKFAASLSFYNLDLISGGINMEFYEPKLKKGYVEFQDYSLGQMVDEHYVGDFFDGIQQKVTRRSIDHLIVDSITSINMLLGDEIERRKKTLLFSAWASRMGCTTILTAEYDGGSGTERFLADAVIDLDRAEIRPLWGYDSLQGMRGRTIEVAKLRGKSHRNGRYLYGISSEGVKIVSGTGFSGMRGDVSTGIPDLDAIVGGLAPGDRWHVNVEGREPFDTMLIHMVKGSLKAGEGIVLFAPAIAGHDGGSIADRLGPEATEAIGDGRMVVVTKGGLAGKPREGYVPLAERSGGYGKLASEVLALTKQSDLRWRAYVDLTELQEYFDPGMMRDIFDGLIDPIARARAIVTTFSDAGIGLEPASIIDQRSTGVIDVWHMDLYHLLRVRKAPAATTNEPCVIRLAGDEIRLMQL